MRRHSYQLVLIFLGIVATALFGVFLYREIFPEYKIYQNKYQELEEFRSSLTGIPAPPFRGGVQQIVLEQDNGGPPIIDRCISCHVALEIPYFSPTKIAYDVNGNMVLNEQGYPLKVENDQYIWKLLDKTIEELRDERKNEQLREEGKTGEVNRRLKRAEQLENLKAAHVEEHQYDMTKVLTMHPLIGRETRPFEFHPLSEYGCTICHSGNGRGLTTDKAHGPVFDGDYEKEYQGPMPAFTESDPKNDPKFSRVFNGKPSGELLFQTSPLFVGDLIEANCVQCHLPSQLRLEHLYFSASGTVEPKEQQRSQIQKAYEDGINSLITLLSLQNGIQANGLEDTIKNLNEKKDIGVLTPNEIERINGQLTYLADLDEERALQKIQKDLWRMIGSKEFIHQLQNLDQNYNAVDTFIMEHREDTQALGTLFQIALKLAIEDEMAFHASEFRNTLENTLQAEQTVGAIVSDVDALTQNFQKGRELYISQACYACHRIAGFSRGGIGPEHTLAGEAYPWFLKQSIVWPQADLRNSTMPNVQLDHEEIEDLMTFLLAQQRGSQAISDLAKKDAIRAWEEGRQQSWEKAIPPTKIFDLDYSMTIFAVEGCANCHRLQGYESNVGYAVEKNSPTFDELYSAQQWFRSLFFEEIEGSQIVEAIENNKEEIDKKVVGGVRENAILEKIENQSPGLIAAFYTPFKFASRAKNHYYEQLIETATTEEEKKQYQNELREWKDRVHRILMMFVQEYGLGRLICPRPNWSGIFRTDEWLMEHFRNPTAHVPRSIMPVFPFDDTKFYSLTYMLDVLGIRNRDALRKVWEERGFNPEQTFNLLCAQCHGALMRGDGPVAQWIYPIPKNLQNADFLRNLTLDNVMQSIRHGVKGTPMPPWGEVAQDKPTADGIPVLNEREIEILAQWLFSALPGGQVIRTEEDVPKWQYSPEDVLRELEEEGGKLLNRLNRDVESKGSLFPFANLLQNQLTVEDVFNVVPDPVTDGKEKAYYIKKKFYTQENIEAGREYFLLNCAICHGNEADGTGIRAGTMFEAKPRMLVNLDWINTRDDLRLLRSIKYGVPGTSMTPWGDQTSSLQRMQLVMYIRSLSEERLSRSFLAQMIYQAFDNSIFNVKRARAIDYLHIVELEKQLEKVQKRHRQVIQSINQGEASSDEAVKSYQKILELEAQIREARGQDQLYIDLMQLLKKEKAVFENLGNDFLTQTIPEEIKKKFSDLIFLIKGRFEYSDDQLVFDQDFEREKIENLKHGIVLSIEQQIQELQEELKLEKGKFLTAEQRTKVENIQYNLTNFTLLKQKFLSNLQLAEELQQKQKEIFNQIKEETQSGTNQSRVSR